MHLWPTEGATLNDQSDGASPGYEPTAIGDWALQMSKPCSVKLGVMCDTGDVFLCI